ncbi:hypothetical protein DFH07DRAFT_771872 [Mycena maculata]|uniref:Uncharacterized protein n=1 Tax=Mycena maculata TaxID=230809 RepID=A0AAD7NGU6_9AGAR|nr:hypothetical protein DFH07DRAFT_771872 [Mycena maculata]
MASDAEALNAPFSKPTKKAIRKAYGKICSVCHREVITGHCAHLFTRAKDSQTQVFSPRSVGASEELTKLYLLGYSLIKCTTEALRRTQPYVDGSFLHEFRYEWRSDDQMNERLMLTCNALYEKNILRPNELPSTNDRNEDVLEGFGGSNQYWAAAAATQPPSRQSPVA